MARYECFNCDGQHRYTVKQVPMCKKCGYRMVAVVQPSKPSKDDWDKCTSCWGLGSRHELMSFGQYESVACDACYGTGRIGIGGQCAKR